MKDGEGKQTESKIERWRNRADQEIGGSTEQHLTSLPPFLSPPLLPSLPTLSSPASTLPSHSSPCCFSLLPSPLSSALPPSFVSPVRTCSIWEGLLGLASLQCRGGQDGCLSTMRWKDGAPGETRLPGVWFCVSVCFWGGEIFYMIFTGMYNRSLSLVCFYRCQPCWLSGCVKGNGCARDISVSRLLWNLK